MKPLFDENDSYEYVAEAPERLDVFAARVSGLTRARVQKLIGDGLVTVDGAPQKANFKLKSGQRVTLDVPPPEDADILPENIPLDIVYEDSDIVVVNKPKGMVVHPAAGNASGTLVNALMYHIKDLSGIGGQLRPGIVHRIDKDTTGLIVVAKNDAAHAALADQLKTHSIWREYLALVVGGVAEDGIVDAPIARSQRDRKKMAVVPGGREAVTHYQVIERLSQYTLLRVRLETGRTHQIRVHMALIGHPGAGDAVYGSGKNKLGLTSQALHAARLTLTHPSSGEPMTFTSPLPDTFKAALKSLGSEFNA
jgi:23S rRNA pseudouridine1911/1915/1917 synthase